jgi:hypothetical protein
MRLSTAHEDYHPVWRSILHTTEIKIYRPKTLCFQINDFSHVSTEKNMFCNLHRRSSTTRDLHKALLEESTNVMVYQKQPYWCPHITIIYAMFLVMVEIRMTRGNMQQCSAPSKEWEQVTCSVGKTSNTACLIFQRWVPFLLRLRHISQIINIDMPSCCCNNQPVSYQWHRIYTLWLSICSNKCTLWSTYSSWIPAFDCFIPAASDHLSWMDKYTQRKSDYHSVESPQTRQIVYFGNFFKQCWTELANICTSWTTFSYLKETKSSQSCNHRYVPGTMVLTQLPFWSIKGLTKVEFQWPVYLS